MELRHLRVLVAAVEQGSIQAASRLLNIAQPALTRRIQDLEAELGCDLLIRGGRGVTPTSAGSALYRDALAILQNVVDATQRAQRMGLDQQRKVRFGLVQTARKYGFAQEAISAFNARHPDAGVALMRGLSRDLGSALHDGDLDLTLLFEFHAGVVGVADRLIHRERYVLALHPSHRLAQDAPARLADLVGEPMVCVLRHDMAGQHNALLQHCRLHGLEPVIGQWANSPDEMMDMVAVGAGMCITPASSIISTPAGQLVFRALPEFSLRLDLRIAWRTPHNSPVVGALLQEFDAAVDRHHDSLSKAETPGATLHGLQLFDTGGTS